MGKPFGFSDPGLIFEKKEGNQESFEIFLKLEKRLEEMSEDGYESFRDFSQAEKDLMFPEDPNEEFLLEKYLKLTAEQRKSLPLDVCEKLGLEKITNLIEKNPSISRSLEDLAKHHRVSYKHELEVAQLAFFILKKIDLDENEKEDFLIAALLHDHGKIKTPLAVLAKEEGFDLSEQAIIQEHSGHSRDYANQNGFGNLVRAITGGHHDYTGSPNANRTKSENADFLEEKRNGDLRLEKLTKFFSIIDIFHSLYSAREYSKERISPEKCREFLKKKDCFQGREFEEMIDLVANLFSDTKESATEKAQYL